MPRLNFRFDNYNFLLRGYRETSLVGRPGCPLSLSGGGWPATRAKSDSFRNDEDATRQLWSAKVSQSLTSSTSDEYREIDELEIQVEIELDWTASTSPKPVLRYPLAEVSQLQAEAEVALQNNRAITAADLYEQALLLLEIKPQPGLKGHLLNGLGRAQHHKGRRQEAQATLGLALALARLEADLEVEQDACYGLGLVYLKESRLPLATDNLRQALGLARQRQTEAGEGRILLELGVVYLGQLMLNRAAPCLLMARRIFTRPAPGLNYEEIKQAERRISDSLREVRKRAEQVNRQLGIRQYESWLAEFEAGQLLPE